MSKGFTRRQQVLAVGSVVVLIVVAGFSLRTAAPSTTDWFAAMKFGTQKTKIKSTKKMKITLKEGDQCSTQYDWCGTGLRCEVISATPAASAQSVCRRTPPAVHGAVRYVFDNWENIQEFSDTTGTPISVIQAHAQETSLGIEVPMNDYLQGLNNAGAHYTMYLNFLEGGEDGYATTEILFDTGGKFTMNPALPHGLYTLITKDPVAGSSILTWIFTVNGGPEMEEIALDGKTYNDDNFLRLVDFTDANLQIPEEPDW